MCLHQWKTQVIMQKTIFILEDNADLRELYLYIFADNDYKISSFSTVAEFMLHWNEIPDLYLLDVMLPDGDGIDLCQKLKNNSLSANTPVVMVSAHKDISEVKMQCPNADFLAKPFDIEELNNRVAKHVH